VVGKNGGSVARSLPGCGCDPVDWANDGAWEKDSLWVGLLYDA